MRMWEIRENTGRYDREDRGGYRMGMRKKYSEDYECGYEDGYEAALREIENKEETSYRKRR
jgi:flagellar biosynthesis/type III secretory pathway protein FliH